jgi:hypothetical protein
MMRPFLRRWPTCALLLFASCSATRESSEEQSAVPVVLEAPSDIEQEVPEAQPRPQAQSFPEVAPMSVSEPARTPYDPEQTPPVPAAGPDGFIDLGWEPLSSWQFIPDETPLPPALEQALDGQRVRIKGHIFPVFESATPNEFVLMRQGWQCCFGRPPEVNEVIRVIVPEDLRQAMPVSMVEVEARDFAAEIVRDDGFVVEIYTMTLVQLRAVDG